MASYASALDDLEKQYNLLGNPLAYATKPTIEKHFQSPVNKKDIDNFLASNNTYTLHRDVRRPQQYNPTYCYRPNELIQIDLATFEDMGINNDGYKYILVAIDCFSRMLYCELIKNKYANTVLEAFKKIRAKMDNAELSRVVSDQGSEFKNVKFKKYCEENDIALHFAKTTKPAMVERVIRTLKSLIGKHQTKTNTLSFYKVLPELVETYNNRIHRMITFPPKVVHNNFLAQERVREINSAKWSKIKKRPPKFRVGEIVRIAKKVGPFNRQYKRQHARELFKIHKVNTNMPIPNYVICTIDDQEVIDGNFNPGELTKVKLKMGVHIKNVIDYNYPYVHLLLNDPHDPQHKAWVHMNEIYNVNKVT